MTEKTKEHRTKYTLATEGPSKALAMEIYKRMLREQPTGTMQPVVVFTAGGAGSGKTTSIKELTQLQNIVDQAQIVYDTTLSSEQSSLEQIKIALDAGKTVKIFYVYRDPDLAFTGMLERAMRTGRPVTLTNFINTHLGAPKVLDSIASAYKKELQNGTVALNIIDNTASLQGVQLAPQGAIFVRARASQYTRDQLKKKLQNALDDAYQKGTISKEIYEAVNK